jgi:hypothetical protein
MAQPIQKIALSAKPSPSYTKWEEITAELTNLKGSQISIAIGEYAGQRWLMFARNGTYEPLALDTAIALEIPCPPFCTEEEFYAVI